MASLVRFDFRLRSPKAGPQKVPWDWSSNTTNNDACVEILILTGQADVAVQQLAGVGYTCVYTTSRSRYYGPPQERVRVWFLRLRTDKLREAGLSVE